MHDLLHGLPEEHLAGGEQDALRMDLDLDLTEFCHLLEGHWKLTSETGVVTELRPGDSWVFPRGWKGRSEVLAKVRKVYYMMVPAQG